MRVRMISPVAALALGAVLTASIVGCAGDDDTGGDTTSPTTIPVGATKAPSDNGGEATEVKISMTDNKYTPSAITVSVGTSVKFELKNDGAAIHNMHILSEKQEGKDFSSEAIVKPGTESSFTVKFTKTGVYDFQCDYHLPDMAGKITVK